MILDRTSDDLGGAGTAAIDQHNHRDVRISSGMGEILLLLAFEPAFGIHDHAGTQKEIGDFDRLAEQPAGIIAQVQHHALEWAIFLAEFLQCGVQVMAGLVLKLGNPDIGIAVFQGF